MDGCTKAFQNLLPKSKFQWTTIHLEDKNNIYKIAVKNISKIPEPLRKHKSS